ELEPNRKPIANADTASAVVGTSQLIDVLANDRDPDGDPLILLTVERDLDDANSSGIRVQGNQVLYSASLATDDDEATLDRFRYTITDGNGNEAMGEVSVRVLPEPIAAPPFAQDDAATTVVDVPVTLDVLRNDGDPSGERPTLLGVPGCPGGGTATVTADGRVTYRPPRGASGVFSCRYQVTNSQGLLASASIVVSVLEPSVTNVAPVVTNEEERVLIGSTTLIDLLANDVDTDGPFSGLRVLSSTTPTLGRATRTGGSISFEAGPVAGIAAISYQVGDAMGGITAGQLVIRIVEPDPVAPLTVDDRRTIVGPGAPTTIDVLSNDSDPDGNSNQLRLVSVDLVSGTGSVQLGTRTVTFTPDPAFVGDLVATYVVEDATRLRATGRVTLTVLDAPNRPPVPVGDVAEVVNGGSVTVPIAFNDADPDGDPLTYSLVTSPDAGLGAARLVSNAIVFDAVPGVSGVATMVYRVNDGEATADATVTITVLACGVAPPEAPDVFLQTGYQQPISIDLTKIARNGVIVDVGAPLSAPTGVYTPPAGENGTISFTYVVRNSCRIQNVGRVTIDVNQEPLGAPYQARIGRIDPVVVPVSALASDAEPLVIVELEGAPAWISIVDQRRAVLVDPAGNTGRVDLVAVIADPGGLRVRVPISIELVNLAPTANDDTVPVPNGPVTFAPLANDVDPDGDAISLAAVPATIQFPNGATGTVERVGAGQLRVDPAGGVGVGTFSYTVVDAVGATSGPAIVTVTVNGPPSAPDVEITVPAGESVVVPVPSIDPEGDTILLVILGATRPLSVTVGGLGITVFAPLGQEGLQMSVRYAAIDASGATRQGTLFITVGPPPTTTTSTTTSTTPPATSTTTSTTTTTTSTSTTSTTTSTTLPPSSSTPPPVT
ncbi:MAG: Ig-like domain-containing protein, partial [Ilumatobacteraceae bacterium]